MPTSDPEVTELLHAWSRGDAAALERLAPLIFEDLRRMARRHLRGERDAHTLAPTALVNEVYLKLMEQRSADWQNREQFFAVASRIMRRVLMDYGKAHGTAKRGKDVVKVPLETAFEVGQGPDMDLLVFNDALDRLGELDPRQRQIVELKLFYGFEHQEIAELLGGISATTSKREWRAAKLWLLRELSRK
jgi:RNA polymerase sigma-70 factor (ECF subfamily)